ncbi:MAG TPA: T9SS type A sorting domain-containing protein, partial [Bacteroidales bacterium]|nr:T9SS type A sorting domain-containing protein [Bacteroidales bacterium]
LSGLYLYQFLKPYLEAVNSLGENIINPATPLLTGSGYGLWPIASQTFEYTGKPNTGTISTGISYTDASKGYNLVGNPYPSAIDWNSPSGWEGNEGISDWLIIFNPSVNNYGMYLRNSGTGTNGVSNIIPPGQGYFVRAIDDMPHFCVNNSARINNTDVPFFKSEEAVTSLKLNVSGASGSDEVVVRFQPGSSEYYDPKEDGLKFFGPSDSPQAYMVTQPSGTKISVSTLPSITPDMQIPLFIEFGMEGSYSITASGISSFPIGVNVFLEDKKNGNSVNLTAVTTYAFEVASGDPADRFRIRILSGAIGILDVNPDQPVKIYSSANDVYVNSSTSSTLTVFDMTGRQVTGNIKLKEQNSKVSLNVSTGYYVVKVMASSGVFSQKLFIQ